MLSTCRGQFCHALKGCRVGLECTSEERWNHLFGINFSFNNHVCRCKERTPKTTEVKFTKSWQLHIIFLYPKGIEMFCSVYILPEKAPPQKTPLHSLPWSCLWLAHGLRGACSQTDVRVLQGTSQLLSRITH